MMCFLCHFFVVLFAFVFGWGWQDGHLVGKEQLVILLLMCVVTFCDLCTFFPALCLGWDFNFFLFFFF